ncbi:hypothetical protein D3C84_502860 [compost metagenome]
MHLTGACGDVASALGDHRAGLVVIALVEKAAARVEVPPQIAGLAAADLASPRGEGFRVHRLGNPVAPRDRVQGAEQVGDVRRCGALAGIARAAGELTENIATWMADDIGLLELGHVVLSHMVGRAVAAGLGGRGG